MILIYIASLEHISYKIFMKWTKEKSWDFTNPPHHNLWRPQYPNDTPKFNLIHQKMRSRCKNNYIEAFGVVNWVKKCCLKKILGVATAPFRGWGLDDTLCKKLMLTLLAVCGGWSHLSERAQSNGSLYRVAFHLRGSWGGAGLLTGGTPLPLSC